MIRRGVWLGLLVATMVLAVLRSDVGFAQVDTTSTTEPAPYAFVLGEQISPPPSDGGQALASGPPASSMSPPVFIAWLQDASNTWRDLPLWSQAAVVSGAIATFSLGLIQLVRRLAEMVLEGLGER